MVLFSVLTFHISPIFLQGWSLKIFKPHQGYKGIIDIPFLSESPFNQPGLFHDGKALRGIWKDLHCPNGGVLPRQTGAASGMWSF
jgi:hypothetical protein